VSRLDQDWGPVLRQAWLKLLHEACCYVGPGLYIYIVTMSMQCWNNIYNKLVHCCTDIKPALRSLPTQPAYAANLLYSIQPELLLFLDLKYTNIMGKKIFCTDYFFLFSLLEKTFIFTTCHLSVHPFFNLSRFQPFNQPVKFLMTHPLLRANCCKRKKKLIHN
jgi:hypothetical protein